jgi:hypothetical protein
MPTCSGSPTFDLYRPNAFWEWPEKIPGLICKTPPIGYWNSPRLAQCCSGPVYNITTPTSPDDPAYPVSCALFCQIDPVREQRNFSYPYGFSDFFMCLTNGQDPDANDGGLRRGIQNRDEPIFNNGADIVCATITVPGVSAPTSYPNSPTGLWLTKSYLHTGDPFFDTAYSTTPTGTGAASNTKTSTTRNHDSTTTTSSAPTTSTSASSNIAGRSTTASWSLKAYVVPSVILAALLIG